MTYRRRHFSSPRLDAVIELIFFDRSNPRSVAYQIRRASTAKSPVSPASRTSACCRKSASMPRTRPPLLDHPARPDAAEFDAFFNSIEVFSDLLTQHFFSHSVRRVY